MVWGRVELSGLCSGLDTVRKWGDFMIGCLYKSSPRRMKATERLKLSLGSMGSHSSHSDRGTVWLGLYLCSACVRHDWEFLSWAVLTTERP